MAINPERCVMPLIPVAQAAAADSSLGAVRFVMKDGSKKVTVLVSSPALENVEIADDHGYFCTFKLNRKSFEQIASTKYENGFVEPDGTVCIRAVDMPLASVN
jgi:Protein of unknown function (DUF1488)